MQSNGIACGDELGGRLQAAISAPHGYVRLLESCGAGGALTLRDGKRIHAHMVECGHAKHLFLRNHLLLMYARCGCLEDARNLFEGMEDRNVISWNTMVRAFAHKGQFQEALCYFLAMLQEGTRADQVSCLSLIKAPLTLPQARLVHCIVDAVGFDEFSYVFIGTAMVGMYGKCGALEDAVEVFDCIPDPGTVSWNALMTVFSKAEQDLQHGIVLFRRMLLEGVEPNAISFVCASKACASLGRSNIGDLRIVHWLATEAGFVNMVAVANSFMHAYDKCKCLEEARALFESMPERDVASWNTIIAAYAQAGHFGEAFRLYERLRTGSRGIAPDSITFVNVLEACNSPRELAEGKMIHLHVKDAGLESNKIVGTALVSMFRRCGNMEKARELFARISMPCVITWNAMIAAYAQYGHLLQGLQLFRIMLQEGVSPSEFTFVTVLSLCADKATLSAGRSTHSWILESKHRGLVLLDNGLINMYGKCGCLEEAAEVFDGIKAKNVASWNSMVVVYAQHGHSEQALDVFYRMEQCGVVPDQISYTAVLSASSHSGLLEQGCQIFYAVQNDHSGIQRSVEHYGCIVSLLGKRGCLAEAEELLEGAPASLVDASAWMSLVTACKAHGENDMALRAAEHVVRLEPNHAGCYTAVSNIFSS